MNKKSNTKDVVGGVVFHNGLILMAQRSCKDLNGKWEFPGGKVEQGESHQEALKRELKEELDVNTGILEKIASNKFKINGKSYILHCYRVDILNREPVAKEHHLLSWVSIDKLLELDLAPADIPIAKEVCKYDW